MPPGTHPMRVSLHWDGTNAHGQASTPITIGVANTNSVSSTTQFCIGYIPIISDLGSAFASSATEIKYHIRNKAIAAMLRIFGNKRTDGCALSVTIHQRRVPRVFSDAQIVLNESGPARSPTILWDAQSNVSFFSFLYMREDTRIHT